MDDINIDDFKAAVALFYKRYTDFQGRSARWEFWYVFAYIMAAYILFAMLGGLMGGGIGYGYYSMFTGFSGLLLGLFMLANIVPMIALGVRRLHDLDLSGWWAAGYVVASLIPFINLLAFIAMIVFFIRPGTEGPNQYGDAPE